MKRIIGLAVIGVMAAGYSFAVTPDGMAKQGAFGVDVGVGVGMLKADIGGEDFSDTPFTPQGAVFYGLNDMFDLRVNLKYADAKDDQEKMKILRTGIGTRANFATETPLKPYAGAAITYYSLSSDTEGTKNEKGMAGLMIEGGVSYSFYHWMALQIGVEGEISLTKGSIETYGGKSHDIKLYGIGALAALEFTF